MIKQHFDSDYMEGAHPLILEALIKANMEKNAGYGSDEHTAAAKEKIRTACNCPEAEIYFLAGGTMTNETVISGLLKSYEGVISASTGHIAVHEAGAIEHGGHKVLTLDHDNGLIYAEQIEHYMKIFQKDANNEHMVKPGMVYISFPSEYGTIYSLEEIKAISSVCSRYNLKLFIDGARLGYGLAADTDVTLKDIAAYADIFYIGGTKVGALCGEAVVIPKPGLIPHFLTIIKQHNALLAKGFLLGIQFETLFTDDLYMQISHHAVDMAMKIKKALCEKGYELFIDSPTNQQFFKVSEKKRRELDNSITYGFIETIDDSHSVIRICTSWATREEDVDALIKLI